MIVGVAPRDPGVLVMVSLLLLVVGTVAGVVPAYRAAVTDPVAGLREE